MLIEHLRVLNFLHRVPVKGTRLQDNEKKTMLVAQELLMMFSNISGHSFLKSFVDPLCLL